MQDEIDSKEAKKKLPVPPKVFRWVFSFIGVIIAILVGTWLMGRPLLYWNVSVSAPLGLYVACLPGPLQYDDYVIVRLSKDYGNLKQGTLLLKQVQGLPGDIYIRRDGYVEVHGYRYIVVEKEGLPQIPKGSYMVASGQALLLNKRENSFDGRYIGPTEDKYIVRRVFLALDRDAYNKKEKEWHDRLVNIF